MCHSKEIFEEFFVILAQKIWKYLVLSQKIARYLKVSYPKWEGKWPAQRLNQVRLSQVRLGQNQKKNFKKNIRRGEQGRQIQNWLWGLASKFSNYWGRGKIAPPQISNIGGGGKILKIPTYLVLKGEKFSTPFKTRFWTFHEGYPKKVFESPKIFFFLFSNAPQKISQGVIFEKVGKDFEKIPINFENNGRKCIIFKKLVILGCDCYTLKRSGESPVNNIYHKY